VGAGSGQWDGKDPAPAGQYDRANAAPSGGTTGGMTTDGQYVRVEEIAAEAAWLGRLARALVGAEAAGDLVQEAYLSALESPPRRGGSLRGWLRAVLRNRSAMRFRAERR